MAEMITVIILSSYTVNTSQLQKRQLQLGDSCLAKGHLNMILKDEQGN